MDGGIDASIGTSLDCGKAILNRVPTIDALKSLVVEGFDAQFERDEKSFVLKICQILQDIIFDAIGTCANDEPDNIFDRKSLLVTMAQQVQRSIGVGIGLEIGQILHIRILARKEALPCFELFADAGRAATVGRIERISTTEGASSRPNVSITIGTGESTIKHEFLEFHEFLRDS